MIYKWGDIVVDVIALKMVENPLFSVNALLAEGQGQ
jgi:hypothetical protein